MTEYRMIIDGETVASRFFQACSRGYAKSVMKKNYWYLLRRDWEIEEVKEDGTKTIVDSKQKPTLYEPPTRADVKLLNTE